MLITGPYLAFSPFLGTEKVEPNDYGRCFGLLATLFGVLMMEGTLLFSAENAFYSLQEMQKNVRLEIIETSDRRERQKLEYLLHDLHHLKPLSACNLFAIDKSIITSCLTIRYNSYSLLYEILINKIIISVWRICSFLYKFTYRNLQLLKRGGMNSMATIRNYWNELAA